MVTNAAARFDGSGPLDLLSTVPDDAAARPRPPRPLARAGWLLAIVAALAVVVPWVSIHNQREIMLSELGQRLGILARGRAEVFGAWLEGMTRPVDRVVNSEMFRLFATEIDLSLDDMAELATGKAKGDSTGGGEVGIPLAAQIPFMSQVLTDFAKSEGFAAGHLIDRNGIAYVSTAGAPALNAGQKSIAQQALKSGILRYGPVRLTAGGLVLDIFAPVRNAQSGDEPGAPAGVVLLSVPVSVRLSQLLTPPPLSEAGERLRLIQLVAGELYEIAPSDVPALRPAVDLDPDQVQSGIGFQERKAVTGGMVYSVGAPVAGPAWWVVQEIDTAAVAARLHGFVVAVIAGAGLVVLAVAAVFGAFWWRLANDHSAALAEQYRRMAARIEAQKRLLDGINHTITDQIGLKALDGTYRYLNPAFARMIGKDVAQAIGQDDTAIFGKGTADRLKHSDQRALTSGAPVTVSEEIYLGPKPHHLQITKVPFRGDSGVFSGIVSVGRDVTELVEEQRKRERAVRQTVAALIRAVELRDPYLAGHSRRVAGFCAAVARRMGASPEDIATAEIAANLSQIGKLGIPRELLTKPGRLTAKETARMRGHLEHAAKILQGLDFDLPVLDTIMAMHERLDGKGYPAGLSGEAISMPARILGVCDVFCARLEPRSYRRGIAVEAAIEILEQNDGRYDPRVVAALRAVAQSVAGEKLMADLDTA